MKLVNIHILLIISLLGLMAGKSSAQIWSLEQCLDTARVHNKNIQINRNDLEISEQRHHEARANLLPKLSANADYKYYTDLPYQLMPLSTFNPDAAEGEFKSIQFGVPHNISANLQLSVPLYSPQIYGAIEGTKTAAELSVLQLHKTEEQVFFEISNLYYNAQILHHQLNFIDSNLVNADRLLANIELLHAQMMATTNDVNRAKLQASQLAAQQESIQGKYTQVMNGLKFLLGLPGTAQLEIDPNINYVDNPDYVGAQTLDMAIAKTKFRVLQNELNVLHRSRYLPSVNLFATYGTTGFGYDQAPNNFLDFFPIGFAGLQLSYPLFNGTVTRRKIDQKTLEIKNNELQHGLLSDQNSMQLDNARLQSSVARAMVKTSNQQIELAESVYRQTLLQQKQGIANLTDVLLAENALREAQQTYLNAVVEYLKSDLEIKRLTNQLRN